MRKGQSHKKEGKSDENSTRETQTKSRQYTTQVYTKRSSHRTNPNQQEKEEKPSRHCFELEFNLNVLRTSNREVTNEDDVKDRVEEGPDINGHVICTGDTAQDIQNLRKDTGNRETER